MTSNDYKEMEQLNRKNKMWVYLSQFPFLILQSHFLSYKVIIWLKKNLQTYIKSSNKRIQDRVIPLKHSKTETFPNNRNFSS